MAGVLDSMGYVQKQGDIGRERGQQSRLGQLYSQALQAPQDQRTGILGQIAQVSPEAVGGVQKQLSGMDSDAYAGLVRDAGMFSALAESGDPQAVNAAYQQLAQKAMALGHAVPPTYDPKYLPMIQKMAASGAGQSSELTAFNAYTQGLSPDDQLKARRIQLGLDPRAVTGAIKFDTFTGADGRPRPQRNNPSTGGVEIFYDETGQWVPLGAGPAPAQGVQLDSMPYVFDDDMGQAPQRVQAAIHDQERAAGGVPLGGALPPRLDYQNGGQRVPGLGVGRSPEEQAALTTTATEAAKLGFLPQTEAIKADAAVDQSARIGRNSAQIAQDAKLAVAAQQKAVTLDMYETAMKGLREGLAGTETGPIAGRIPAVTSGQQIAEGAVAAMAPILKQLFRAAGEGTFTDRDQALLLEMVPKRTDTPQARAAKMTNIDAIVRAKLRTGAASPAPSAAGDTSVDDLLGKYGIR